MSAVETENEITGSSNEDFKVDLNPSADSYTDKAFRLGRKTISVSSGKNQFDFTVGVYVDNSIVIEAEETIIKLVYRTNKTEKDIIKLTSDAKAELPPEDFYHIICAAFEKTDDDVTFKINHNAEKQTINIIFSWAMRNKFKGEPIIRNYPIELTNIHQDKVDRMAKMMQDFTVQREALASLVDELDDEVSKINEKDLTEAITNKIVEQIKQGFLEYDKKIDAVNGSLDEIKKQISVLEEKAVKDINDVKNELNKEIGDNESTIVSLSTKITELQKEVNALKPPPAAAPAK